MNPYLHIELSDVSEPEDVKNEKGEQIVKQTISIKPKKINPAN